MDKTTTHTAEKKEKRTIGERIRAAALKRTKDKIEPIYDIITLVLGFLFARSHVLFGAHPLGLAYVALLPKRVWIATLGAVLGSLTLGKSGVIYAMISVIVVFLRIIISGTSEKESKEVFSERLILRMSASVIGGFIAAVYEVLLTGFNLTTVAFGVSMILVPPLAVFAASGVFDGPSLYTLLTADARLLSVRGKKEGERYSIIFYQCSALFALLAFSFSLREYSFIGISLGYTVAALLSLLAARRFGSMRAMAIGFVLALPLSGSFAAAFALVGLAAGFLFKVGLVYGLVGGGVILSLFCAYVGGLTGFLSVLPEYMIGALASAPLIKRLSPEKSEEEGIGAEREITDMIGTVALSYKSKYSGALDSLSLSLGSLAAVVAKHGDGPLPVREAEIRALVIDVANRYIRERSSCTAPDAVVTIPDAIADKMTTIIVKNGKITPEVFDGYPSFDGLKEGICDTVNRASSILREEKFRIGRDNGYSEYLDLLSKLLTEARRADEREKSVNDELSLVLPSALATVGLTLGSGKVFGYRRPHFIIAAEDESGKKISSPEFKKELESLSERRLATPEFYRRGRMALFECDVRRELSANAAFAGCPRDGESHSGDTVRFYERDDGYFSALICDGVGSGEGAEAASAFVGDFLSSTDGTHTALRLLNHIIRKRGEEFAATVDLFTLDLFTGEAHFMKCGAAVSYVKRGTSIFRLRSHSSALGVLRSAECERIRVEIADGDLVIMVSDGVTAGEDSPWFYELLAKEPPESLSDYANLILTEAKRRTGATDDMSVAVIRISKK